MNTILEKGKNLERLYSHVSITAKPFFHRFSFVTVKEQKIEIGGCLLKNYIMERTQPK